METVVMYLFKVICCSGIMFGYYHLFLRDRSFHQYNRGYLLLTALVSILLPLLRTFYFTIKVHPAIYSLLASSSAVPPDETAGAQSHSWMLLIILLVVSLILLSRLLLGILHVLKLRRKYPLQQIEEVRLYITDLDEAPFSFFKNIFWKDRLPLDSEQGQKVLKHELTHIRQCHSWDKIIFEVITALWWVNPFFWLIKKELFLIHEFLADRKAVSDADATSFIEMLLATRFPETQLPLTNPLISSNLKKRIKMITTPKTSYGYGGRLLALPLLFTLAFIYMVKAENRDITTFNAEIQEFVLKQDTIIVPPIAPSVPEKNSFSEETESLAKESEQAAKRAQEAAALAAENAREIETWLHSPEFKADLKKAERAAKKAAKSAQKIEAQVNSPEFKARIKEAERRAKEAEARFNSPEFKERIKEAERKAKEAEARFNSPEFKAKIKEAERKAKEAEARFNSSEFQKGWKEYEGQIKKGNEWINSAAAQSRLKNIKLKTPAQSTENFELKLKEMKGDVKKWEATLNLPDNKKFLERIKEDARRPETFHAKAKNIKILLNGREISASEMEQIQPQDIVSVDIIKTDQNSGTIHIQGK